MQSSFRLVLTSAVVSGITSFLVSAAVIAPQLSTKSQLAAQTSSVGSVAVPLAEGDIVQTVQKSEPAVVSVIISKNLPVIEREWSFDDFFNREVPSIRENGTRLMEIGGGTAFFVSSDGLLMTNKHVVSDPSAQYTVLLNDGRKLAATVVGRDPMNDIALLKVDGSGFPFLTLAESEPVLGQSVIAIGNALGEFRNTVSVGVVSGLQRDILAGNPAIGQAEHLSRILQTDAAINEGNSGGPLLDRSGAVIGMSTAVATNAQNIGFAIPVMDLTTVLKSYQQYGHIVRPYIGVRYTTVEQGNLVSAGESTTESAVLPNSPAAKAGLQANDIITAVDGQPITSEFNLSDAIQRKLPGDTVSLTILRDGKEQTIRVTLTEWKEEA